MASTGGTRSVNPGGAWLSLRGGGISVSPGNSYFAWTCSDTQQIFVLNYLPGSNPGSGSGVVIGGPRTTASVGGIAPLTSATQGTTWLNDWTLIALNGYGEIVKLDLRNHAVGGSQNNTMAGWQPEVMSDWTVANNDVPLSGQYTSITYNPAVAPNLIFGAATFLGSFEAHLFVYNYNPATQAISLAAQMTVPVRPDGSTLEPREIALDSQGNLYFICYVNSTATLPALPTSHLVAKFTGATNLSNWVDDSHVSAFYDDTQFSSYNGMDVASTLSGLKMGDANGDGQVNTLDLLQLATHWNDGRTFHAFWEGDFNRDGKVNVVDLLYMADKWGR